MSEIYSDKRERSVGGSFCSEHFRIIFFFLWKKRRTRTEVHRRSPSFFLELFIHSFFNLIKEKNHPLLLPMQRQENALSQHHKFILIARILCSFSSHSLMAARRRRCRWEWSEGSSGKKLMKSWIEIVQQTHNNQPTNAEERRWELWWGRRSEK